MMRLDYEKEWAVLGVALDAFNNLESRMEDAICAHLGTPPNRIAFLREQILHNSSLTFASKVRVVLSVSKNVGGPKLKRDSFHRALSIRNALAHGDSRRLIRENRNALRNEPLGEFLVVRSIKGDGTIEETRKSVAIAELMRLIEELRADIENLTKRIEARGSAA